MLSILLKIMSVAINVRALPKIKASFCKSSLKTVLVERELKESEEA